jgi:hypothetical protein
MIAKEETAMKATPKRWPAPSRTLVLASIALVLGGLTVIIGPAPGARGHRPLAARVWPGVPGPLATVPFSAATDADTRPTDRCLIPAPEVDERFAVPAPAMEGRFVVAPLVRGLPVRSRAAAPGR